MKIGRLYKVQFLDHCIGVRKAMVCEVVGWLLNEDKDSITLTHWRIIDTDKDMVNNNHEYTTIIKKAIEKTRWLR